MCFLPDSRLVQKTHGSWMVCNVRSSRCHVWNRWDVDVSACQLWTTPFLRCCCEEMDGAVSIRVFLSISAMYILFLKVQTSDSEPQFFLISQLPPGNYRFSTLCWSLVSWGWSQRTCSWWIWKMLNMKMAAPRCRTGASDGGRFSDKHLGHIMAIYGN